MRRLLALITICAALPSIAATHRVTLLQFSDYHSHPLPFYAAEGADRGGLARAVRYLRTEKRHGALVFNGGDTMNHGAPAWSDKYGCIEWPWFNGVVDAMAFGNHDADYGAAAFARCRESIRYPLLSANTAGMQRYEIFVRDGVRIGVFAVAGNDFKSLVKTPGFTFSDPIAAARDVVRTLRGDEHVDVVVMIGHEHLADDFALARAVPGIDLIFGSHSHLTRELMRIPETSTWFLSPSQYLVYISRVVLTFEGHHLTHVGGGLVPVDARMNADPIIAKRVATLERELERDPEYAPLFETIATTHAAMPLDALARFAVATMRQSTGADVALSTSSSFRQPLPRGAISLETLRAALPYDNEIVVAEMRGEALARLLAYGVSLAGSDSFAIVDGVTTPDPAKTYRVATTDYLAHAPGYRDFFANAQASGKRVRDEVRKALR